MDSSTKTCLKRKFCKRGSPAPTLGWARLGAGVGVEGGKRGQVACNTFQRAKATRPVYLFRLVSPESPRRSNLWKVTLQQKGLCLGVKDLITVVGVVCAMLPGSLVLETSCAFHGSQRSSTFLLFHSTEDTTDPLRVHLPPPSLSLSLSLS